MTEKDFIHRVAEYAKCDERRAEALTFAVFQELRDRLTVAEAKDVAAQLPAHLKALWLSFEKPERSVRRIHLEEFLGDIRRMAALPDDAEARRAVVAVFHAMQQLLQSPTGMEGEAWDVMSQLPSDLKRLWLKAAEETRQ